MIFVGDDWAEDHHDVHLMNESGARLASRRLPEGLAGIGEFHQLLARHAEEPDQVVIGVEMLRRRPLPDRPTSPPAPRQPGAPREQLGHQGELARTRSVLSPRPAAGGIHQRPSP